MRYILAGFAVLMLASCGAPTPRKAVLDAMVSDCAVVSAPRASTEKPALYFVSTALPDCRHSDITFTKSRWKKPVFGRSVIVGGEISTRKIEHQTRLQDREPWLAALVEDAKAAGGLIVFIHGFNNSYEDALSRAELVRRSYETSRPVLVVVWPSRQKVAGYIYDEASAAWSQSIANDTLAELASEKDVGDIAVVAHSMGSRIAIGMVEHLNDADAANAAKVGHVALIAPDVDRHSVLRSGGAIDALLRHDRDVVVYTSQRDWPIRTSRMLHGYSRLGSSDCRYSVDYDRRADGRYGKCHRIDVNGRERLRIVETTFARGDSILKHADVFDSCVGRADLKAFLLGHGDPAWRKLEEDRGDSLTGWYLDPATYRELNGEC